MNITFLAENLTRTGGSSFSLDLMARSLSERGHSITVLTANIFKENGDLNKKSYDIHNNVASSKNRYEGIKNVKRVLNKYEENTDIYHIFNPKYLPISGLYRRKGSVPTVGRINAYDAFCTNPSLMNGKCFKDCTLMNKLRHDDRDRTNKISKVPQYVYQHTSTRFINYLDRIFALSPSIKEVYSHNNVNEKLIDVVPNFYDPEFTMEYEPDIDILLDDLTVTYIGRIRMEKGVDLLIDAVQEMDLSNTAVNIIGEGPIRNEIETEARDANISDSVRFHGWVDQSALSNFYTQSDVFVHPGRWPEPFGRTVLEALQCGCLPVVSDIGAPPWIVGSAGMTFRPNDPSDLANKLTELQRDPNILEQAEKYKSRAEKFEPNRIISKLEAKYREIYD